jgi:hypothetical protein
MRELTPRLQARVQEREQWILHFRKLLEGEEKALQEDRLLLQVLFLPLTLYLR